MQSRLNQESQSERRECKVQTIMGTIEIMRDECDGSSGIVRVLSLYVLNKHCSSI
jgi:hypothetical protein